MARGQCSSRSIPMRVNGLLRRQCRLNWFAMTNVSFTPSRRCTSSMSMSMCVPVSAALTFTASARFSLIIVSVGCSLPCSLRSFLPPLPHHLVQAFCTEYYLHECSLCLTVFFVGKRQFQRSEGRGSLVWSMA